MKKLCIMLLFFITMCIFSVTVFADPYIVTGLGEENKTSVSIVTDCDDRGEYMLYIIKPGFEIDTYQDLENGAWTGLYKMEKLTESKKVNERYNVYTYEFITKTEDESGKYTVIVAGDGFDTLNGRVGAYVNKSNGEAFSQLNTADAATAKEILEKYNQIVWNVDLNNSIYEKNSQKVIANFASVCNTIKSDADVQKAFLISCALTEIENTYGADFFELLEKYQYVFDIEYGDGVKTRDIKFLDALSCIIENDKPSLKNVPELALLLKSTEALNEVNGADRENILKVIEKYKDVFAEIELNTNVDSYALSKELVAEEKGYASINAVEKAYKDAVSKILSETSNLSRPSPSDSGGGGKGGFSAGGVNLSGAVNQDTINTLSPIEADGIFYDVENGHWAQAYIDYLNYNKIMTGDGEGHFRPNDTITREEFIKVLVEALDLQMPVVDNDGEISFEDISSDMWYDEPIKISYNLNIVKGITDTVFGVGMPIIRQDVAVLINRAITQKQLAFSDLTDTQIFSDADAISSYADEPVKILQKAQILNGYEDNTFKPFNLITRAEAAKVIYMVLNKLGMLA